MSILETILLAALGVVVASSHTNEAAGFPAAPSPTVSPIAEDSPVYVQSQSTTAQVSGGSSAYYISKVNVMPSEKLGIHEWVRLIHELGYYGPELSEEEFWARLQDWNDEQLLAEERVLLLGGLPSE